MIAITLVYKLIFRKLSNKDNGRVVPLDHKKEFKTIFFRTNYFFKTFVLITLSF